MGTVLPAVESRKFAALDVFAAFTLQFLVERKEVRPRALILAFGVFVDL